jgi:hypothetical protein
MKSAKIAGLCLVSMLVMSTTVSATASAAPHWLVCSEGTEKVPPTKYTTKQCSTAASELNGKWEWKEPASTELLFFQATLTLKDNGTPIEELDINCSFVGDGPIGPGKFGRIEIVLLEPTNCKSASPIICEKIEAIEAVHLPWQTELFETEKTIRDKITEVAGAKEPGWGGTCKSALGEDEKDECLVVAGKEISALAENRLLRGELLVLANFEKKSGKLKCTQSKGEDGEVLGSIAIIRERGLRVSS